MTIFGFNSNVQRDDVTYHVESQARSGDLLLQTMIFVQGQSVGKHTYSYAAMTLDPGFSEEAMHDLLKAQHKKVMDALQNGPVESVLVASAEVHDVGGAGLSLAWTNSSDAAGGNQAVLKLQVLDSGKPVAGAEVSILAYPPSDGAELARARTDSTGAAALNVTAVGEHRAFLARATHAGKSATRKLRLKK